MKDSNININITSSPIELLTQIRTEIERIVGVYDEQVSVVHEINAACDTYLNTLVEIEAINDDILKTDKQRLRVLRDIEKVSKQINNTIDKQQEKKNDVNNEIEKELANLEKIKRQYQDTNIELTQVINKNRQNAQVLNKTLENIVSINKGLERTSTTTERISRNTTKSSNTMKGWATALKYVGRGLNFIWGYAKGFGEMDSAISKVNANLGYSATQLSTYKKHIYDATQSTTLYGMTADKLVKSQQTYWSQIGRTIEWSVSDMTNVAQLTNIFGDDVTTVLANLEQFGMGTQTAYNFLQRGLDVSKRNGVDIVAHSKMVQENIKLASRYNFRDGLIGLQNMAANSLKIRMNMGEVAKLAERAMTPEGAIETAARLQVLGGNAALNADPMSMLFESLNDFEGLGKRYERIIGGMMRFNRQTGEVNYISGMERQRARAIADAAGLDFDELSTTARTQEVRRQIEGTLANTNYTEELKNIIASKAQYDVNTNTWRVKGADGENRDVNNLTTRDIEYLKPQEEQISAIASSTRGIADNVRDIKDWLDHSVYNVFEKTLGTPITSTLSSIKNQLLGTNPWYGVGAAGGLALGGFALREGGRYLFDRYSRRRGRNSTQFGGRNGQHIPPSGGRPRGRGGARGRLIRGGRFAGLTMLASAAMYGGYKLLSNDDVQQSQIQPNNEIKQENDLVNDVAVIRQILEDKNSHLASNGISESTIKNDISDVAAQTAFYTAYSKLGAKLGTNAMSSLGGIRGLGVGLGLDIGGGLIEDYSQTLDNPTARHGVGMAGALISGSSRGALAFTPQGFGLGALSGGLRYGRDALIDNGSMKQNSGLDYLMTIGSGAAAGAALGSTFGGWGMGIGGAIGGLSTGAEKYIAEERMETVNRFNNTNKNYEIIGAQDQLSSLRTIAKSTYTIEQILIKKFGKLVDEDDLEMGWGEKALNLFNRNILGVAVNDAVIKNGKITPINSKDDLLIGKQDGPLFNNILPKNINFKSLDILNKESSLNTSNSNNLNSSINLNINGTLKLDAGVLGSTSIDMNQLLNNPEFKKEVTKFVFSELSKTKNGGRTIGDLNKFTI